MEKIAKIYLKESGSVPEVDIDFSIYKGAYNNTKIDIYVPSDMLQPDDSVIFAVKTAGIITQPNGDKTTTTSYVAPFKQSGVVINNVEYTIFEQTMPKSFVQYAGDEDIVVNIIKMTNSENPEFVEVVTSQIVNVVVNESEYIDNEEVFTPTQLEVVDAKLNEVLTDLSDKQDKNDTNLQTLTDNVVGAINEVYGVSSANASAVNDLDSRVSALEYQSSVEETYIGQTSGSTEPTDEILNAFVLETAEREAQGGDVVIYIQEVIGTDKNYKCMFSGVTEVWSWYEIPSTEPASNTSKGIVKGNYGEGNNPSTQVNIVNGEIEGIYVVDNSSSKVNVRDYVNNIQSNLTNVINGTTPVAKSTSATNDGDGNNIAGTYLTQNAGVTKTQMKNYALPRVFNDVSFINGNGRYSPEVPVNPMPIYSITTSSVGDFEVFEVEKTIANATFQLSNKNSYTDLIFVASSINASLQFRLTTEIYVDGQYVTANVELTDAVNMLAGQVKKLSFASTMNYLEQVYIIEDGDKIRQTLEVITETSQEIELNVYSNETYPSTFYLNTTSETIITTSGKLGELPVYSIIGSGDATKITFTIPISADIENNVEAMFVLLYSGTTTNETEMVLSYNAQDVQIVTPANNGTNNNATVGTMLSKYASNYDRWVFTGVFKVSSGNISVIADVDDILAYLESYYTKSQINTFLAGKQNILSATQLNAVNSGIDSAKVGQITTNTNNISANASNITSLQSTTSSLQNQVSAHTTSITNLTSRVGTAESDIDSIEAKIPVQASSSNQLADKQFVNSSIQTATAHFRGNWTTWSAVPTNANQYPADADGNKTPTSNDYIVVQDASDYMLETLAGTWKFKYSGIWATDGIDGWLPEYQVNETPLTQAQLDAINSGATTTNIGQIATNTTNIGLNTSAIGDNTSAISGLITRMGTAENNISAIPNNYVSFTTAQNLTDAQKLQARTNIGAGTGGGTSTDVQVDGTSITSGGVADLRTINANYNASTNKLATASDIPDISGLATASSVNSLAGRVSDTETAISTINGKIPSGASSSNQLVDTTTMNGAISTATATFRGTYNEVSDLNLTTSATQSQIATALGNTIATADNNDYCFVEIPTADATPTEIAQVDRYKYNGSAWSFEYTLNSSGFTASQWASINSGANTTNIGQIATNTGNISSLNTNKADKSATVSNVSYDSNTKKIKQTINGTTTDVVEFGANAFNSTTIPTTTASVTQDSTSALTSGGAYTALSGKQDAFVTEWTTGKSLWGVSAGTYRVSPLNTYIDLTYKSGSYLRIPGSTLINVDKHSETINGNTISVTTATFVLPTLTTSSYGNITIVWSVGNGTDGGYSLVGRNSILDGTLTLNGGTITYDSSTQTFTI